MVSENVIHDAGAVSPSDPKIRSIGMADLKEALVKGIADFNAMPTHLIFLCLIYPIITFFIARIYSGLDLLPFAFPLLAGYTLIGPFVATGMYELSHRREEGRFTSRFNAFLVFRSPAIVSTAILGVILLVIYFIWLFVAQAIYLRHFGAGAPESIMMFAEQVTITPAGWALMIKGSGAGLVFAILVLSISVVAFPMLAHRNVGVVRAISTSLQAVLANPVTFAIWGIIVAAALFIGALPFFIGLAVVLPVLGHATWHLYHRVVEI